MALRILRGFSRHTSRYVATRSLKFNTTRSLTVSLASLATENKKVTHTGQVYVCLLVHMYVQLFRIYLLHRYGKKVITEIYASLAEKNK